jgi:hypothetical protein
MWQAWERSRALLAKPEENNGRARYSWEDNIKNGWK